MSIARSYAKALHEAARDNKASAHELDQIESQLDTLARAMTQSRELNVALVSPATAAREKVSVIAELTKKAGASQLVTNFLALLARKERIGLLPEIRQAFSTVRLEAEGGMLGHLVSADPMEPSDVDGLAKAFSQKLGKRVAFRTSTDPALLAGMKVTVNGVTYDGTLRSQLQRLRDRLIYGGSSAIH